MSKTAMVRVVTPERYEELRKILPGLPATRKHANAPAARRAGGGEAGPCEAKWIEVHVTPTRPSPEWLCGTVRVWAVAGTWLEANGFEIEPGCAPYVCEHQVEID